uniref:Uncharacterized protein n=1 Tax=Anopheles arabiensis TaxID=7173 RepID=A0A182IFI8_ANOAR
MHACVCVGRGSLLWGKTLHHGFCWENPVHRWAESVVKECSGPLAPCCR